MILLNQKDMDSPQMYDTVQTLSQLDLKKATPQAAIVAGQITLTAMSNSPTSNGTSNNNNNNNNNNGNNNNNSNGNNNNNNNQNGGTNGLIIKQQQNLQMQQAALNNNNNNNNTTTNNNNNNNNNNNSNGNTNNSSSILQKHMLQQYAQNELDELTAQEISLDLQHLIDDQFREQEALGIFGDIVNNNANGLINNNNILPTMANGVVSAAAKVLQMQQQHNQHHQNLRQNGNSNGNSNHHNGYSRNALAYMPQAVHSGATYSNSSDDNSSVGSETSTIKEEPLDPQEYRRHLQHVTNGNFLGAVTNGNNILNSSPNGTTTNGVSATSPTSSNGLYPLAAAAVANGYGNTNGNGNLNGNGTGSFTTLTPTAAVANAAAAAVLHHQSLPHLTGAHLASLKHHHHHHNGNHKTNGLNGMNGMGGMVGCNGLQQQRKQSSKHVDKGTDEYRRRRERNNIAVRKSREKAKVRSREVEEKVKTLLKEKDTLLRRLEEMTNEIQLHKQIYMQLINHSNPEISRVCRSFLNMSDHGI